MIFWLVAIIWFATVIGLLVVVSRAKEGFTVAVAGTAAIVGSAMPALLITWGLFRYVSGAAGSVYFGEETSLADLGLPEWALVIAPWATTWFGVWLLVRRLAGMR